MNNRINPEMIILARESRGINQSELAEQIGILPTHLSKIERGDYGISPDQLQAVITATNYPECFFYQPGGIRPENLAFRKRAKVPQKMLTPITAKINVLRLHAQLITGTLNINAPDLPAITVNERTTPAKAAIKLRKEWNIGDGVLDNLVRILEANNILVARFNFLTERVDSRIIITENKFPLICYNSTLLGDRQRFSLAFELGQLIMHTNTDLPLEADIAHEANLFAAEFLMPEKEILKDLKDAITIPLLAQLKKKWKVSMIALLYRADDLGLLTPNQKRYLVDQFNKLGIRRREPAELDIPAETPHLINHYLADYKRKTKSSTAEIAQKLCLTTDEFVQLYN